MVEKELREFIDVLAERYGLDEDKKKSLVLDAKTAKYSFYVELVKAFQHYLPLDIDLLRWVKFLCRILLIENQEAADYLVKVTKKIPTMNENEEDDLARELLQIKENKEEAFSENLNIYLSRHVSGFRLQEGKEANLSLNVVYGRIISNVKIKNI